MDAVCSSWCSELENPNEYSRKIINTFSTNYFVTTMPNQYNFWIDCSSKVKLNKHCWYNHVQCDYKLFRPWSLFIFTRTVTQRKVCQINLHCHNDHTYREQTCQTILQEGWMTAEENKTIYINLTCISFWRCSGSKLEQNKTAKNKNKTWKGSPN